MPADSVAQFIDVCQKLYTCYMETDASLVEINPLNRDSKGNIIALDAKFNFDSNALYRHPEIVEYRDLAEEDPAEIEASKFDRSEEQTSDLKSLMAHSYSVLRFNKKPNPEP